MQAVTRFTLTLLIAIVTSLGAFALVGCTDGGQPAQDSASQAQQSASSDAQSSDAGDDEQDNCYGDDLPAVKK